MSTTPTETLDPRIKQSHEAAVDRALAAGVASVYQPIVDMYRGAVVGFEALSRCEVPVGSNVGDLFDQAQTIGRSGELEAAALRSALRARSAVPDDCFLSLNVSTAALVHDQVLDILDHQKSLEGVVLEIHHSDPSLSLGDASEGIDACRSKGAEIAVAQSQFDLGSIETLLEVQPQYLMLGLDVVAGLANNNIKAAVVDSVRHLADAFGVGVIAQGIEDLADMQSLRRMGIGFGQGYLFAAPAVGLQLETQLGRIMGEGEGSGQPLTVSRFVEAVDELTEDDFDAPLPPENRGIGFEVLVTELREPVALLRRNGRTVESVPISLVNQHASIADVVRSALARPQRTRFEPYVCVDEFGSCLGVVRLERLLAALVAGGITPAASIEVPTPSEIVTATAGRAGGHRRLGTPHAFRCAPRHR